MTPFDLSTAKRGQEIPQNVYEYFLNVLSPISLRGGQGWPAGFQFSQEWLRTEDTRNGLFRAVYPTFTSRDGRYYYQGMNFHGEVDSREFMKLVEN